MSDSITDYFNMLGVAPSAAPSLDTLARLQRGHLQAIPFENLNPLAGLAVPLEIPALVGKFTARRGGYCFEHNTLYRHALDVLGFQTTPLLARVRMSARRELASGSEIAGVLEDTFGLAAAGVPGLAAKLDGIARRPA